MSETIFEATLDVAMEIAHNVAPPKEIIELSIELAPGFVLANDVVAKSDLPPFNASRVDGYAVNGESPWQIVGTTLAGNLIDLELKSGQCCYVATGAAIPKNTIAMLKQEDCIATKTEVATKKINDEIVTGQNIRPAGFEAKHNEVVIKSGTKLTPALVGLIAACGYDEVQVYQKPKIDVLIFGDELITKGPSRDGKVRDSIGPQISSWISWLGGQLNEIKFVPDQLAAHVTAIKNSTADLIVTTGGTASGPADHLHTAISQCGGEILIDAVKVRPGYHQLLAQLPNKFLIGLPGNPQSAVIGLLTLVQPFVFGSTNRVKKVFEMRTLATGISAIADEYRLTLARQVTGSTNVGLIEPVDYLDSSMLRGFIDADGYAIIPPGGAKSGDLVQWIKLPTF